MARKYKATGCARFFFALLIIAPLAYFGAAYYNGVNGIDQLKSWFGVEANESNDNEEKMEKTIEELEEENEKLRNENKKLKSDQND